MRALLHHDLIYLTLLLYLHHSPRVPLETEVQLDRQVPTERPESEEILVSMVIRERKDLR